MIVLAIFPTAESLSLWTISRASRAFSRAIEAWTESASMKDSSSARNGPSRLFRNWKTPKIFPSLSLIGMQRTLRVL